MIFKKFKLTLNQISFLFMLGFHLAQWFVISFVSYYLLVMTCHKQEQSIHSDLVLIFTCTQCSVLSWQFLQHGKKKQFQHFPSMISKMNSIVILFDKIRVLLFLIIHSMVITVGQLQSKN